MHDGDAAVDEALRQARGQGAREHLLLHVLEVEDQGDGDIVLHERGGDLGADVATTDDDHVAVGADDLAEALVVRGGAVVDDARSGVDPEDARLGAGGQQQLAVADAGAVREAYDVRVRVERGDGRVGDQVYGVVVIEVARERVALEGGVVLEPQVLRQGRAVDGLVGLGAEDRDGPALVLGADAGDGARGGDTSTDDDVVVGLLHVAHVRHRDSPPVTTATAG